MLSAIIISPDENFRDNTRKLLGGVDLVDVRTEFNDFNSALDSWISEENTKLKSVIIVVDVTLARAQAFQVIQKTIELYKNGYVFAAGDRTDMELVLRCMRAGAKEFLSAPIETSQLFPAIERVKKVALSRPLGR